VAAMSIGKHFEVSNSQIILALEDYVPNNNRSQIIKKENHSIILDAYNANPSSMSVALNNFNNLTDSHKTVILGDMFELGITSPEEHQHIALLAEELNFDNIILVGEHFSKTKTSKSLKFKDFEAFKKSFKAVPNSTYLIKGSRGMALERVLDLFD
jgi:UDP-N-acetylmuramoyl-tripeptide--D-alanyl-D-alanine ligase